MPKREGVEELPIGDVLTIQQKKAIFRLELACGQHPGAARKLLGQLTTTGADGLFPGLTVDQKDSDQMDALRVTFHELLEVFVSCIDNARG